MSFATTEIEPLRREELSDLPVCQDRLLRQELLDFWMRVLKTESRVLLPSPEKCHLPFPATGLPETAVQSLLCSVTLAGTS